MSNERNPYSNVRRPMARCNMIDTHEVMKREIYRQGHDSDTNFRITNPPILGPNSSGEPDAPLEVGFEDTYIYFDSTQSNGTSDYANGEVNWSITTLNNSVDIKNCIAIKMFEFQFPNILTAATAPDYFYFLRVFVEIQNVPSTQAVLGPMGNRFHIEFKVEDPTGQSVRLVPQDDTFYFQRPLLSLTDLQLRFLVPPTTSAPANFKRVPIPADTVTLLSLTTGGFGFNPIRFQITGGDTTSVLGLVGSLGVPGLAVFITGYASNAPAVNTAVNNPLGVFATTVLDATTFEIAGINATTVTAQFTATMYIPKNRFGFRVRFSSVRNQLTNHMEFSHD